MANWKFPRLQLKMRLYSIFLTRIFPIKRSQTNPNGYFDVLVLAMGLLKYLTRALISDKEHKFRPYMEHFFLHKVNILKNVSQELGDKAADVLQKIIEGGILNFLPKESEVEDVISFAAGIEEGASNLLNRSTLWEEIFA